MGSRRHLLTALLIAGVTLAGCRRAAGPAEEEEISPSSVDTASSNDYYNRSTAATDTGDGTGTETGDGPDTGDGPGTDTRDGPDAEEESDTGDGPDTETAGGSDMLLPIAVGNRWIYEVETFTETPLCFAGQYTSEITEIVVVDEEETYEMISFCNYEGWGQPASRLRIGEDGQSVDRYYGDWFILIDTPVEEGHSWPCEHGECAWETAGTVNVPAGTFDDCWRRVPVTPDEYAFTDIYCRGVGVVESRIENNYTATLVEYELR
jgi:hypothetical protein